MLNKKQTLEAAREHVKENMFLQRYEVLLNKNPDLANGIKEHYGFKQMRDIMGLNKTRWNENLIIKEIKIIVNIINKFPTEYDLKDLDRYDLAKAISNHGGYVYYQKLLGYESKNPDGYYTEEKITELLIPIQVKHGKLTWSIVEKEDTKLYCAINNGTHKKKWTGLEYFKYLINNKL